MRNSLEDVIVRWDAWAWSIQIASCFFMAGVIAVIQLIHYPSFRLIERSEFRQFHNQHGRALTLIAGPVMCTELASALWLTRTLEPIFLINAIGVVALWLLTFFVSVPTHNRLIHGFDESACTRLINTNWIRTGLWLGRSLMFLILLLNK